MLSHEGAAFPSHSPLSFPPSSESMATMRIGGLDEMALKCEKGARPRMPSLEMVETNAMGRGIFLKPSSPQQSSRRIEEDEEEREKRRTRPEKRTLASLSGETDAGSMVVLGWEAACFVERGCELSPVSFMDQCR